MPAGASVQSGLESLMPAVLQWLLGFQSPHCACVVLSTFHTGDLPARKSFKSIKKRSRATPNIIILLKISIEIAVSKSFPKITANKWGRIKRI